MSNQDLQQNIDMVLQSKKHCEDSQKKPSKSIHELFKRFQAIFGSLFEKEIISPDILIRKKMEWSIALHDFTEQDIDMAASVCATKCKFFPTIAEFIDIITPIYRRRLEEECAKQRKLENEQMKKCDPEINAKFLSEIKKKLNGFANSKKNDL